MPYSPAHFAAHLAGRGATVEIQDIPKGAVVTAEYNGTLVAAVFGATGKFRHGAVTHRADDAYDEPTLKGLADALELPYAEIRFPAEIRDGKVTLWGVYTVPAFLAARGLLVEQAENVAVSWATVRGVAA